MGTITQISAARKRTLYLVDIENLIGDPVAKGPIVRETLDGYRALAGWQPGDHTIVAANPGLSRELVFQPSFDGATRTVRGPDAADEYLLAGAPPEWVEKRFGWIVIGSGDHIFAPRARVLRDLGVHVTVVSRSESLSGALKDQGFAARIFAHAAGNHEAQRAA